MAKYEAWETQDPGCTLFESSRFEEVKSHPASLLTNKLYEFEAATQEEAHSIHNLRMGWGPTDSKKISLLRVRCLVDSI